MEVILGAERCTDARLSDNRLTMGSGKMDANSLMGEAGDVCT